MIIHKVFWAWDDEKEETWLSQMAQSGWHLAQVKLFTYIFVAGEPRDFVYRLDLMPTVKKKDEYFQLFHDAGWEHVDKLVGWEYWRKEVKPGQDPEIFTDQESKSRKYKLLLRIELIAGILLVADVLCLVSIAWIYREPSALSVLCIPLFFVPLITFVCMRLWSRIRQVKHQ